ncbi:DNA helicase [Tanacetum coccineum]|uniref:ATP-dependent DNA helicase n=1 Tax=Tanacetum coccineum TaxID=301880 RepID=A0ABQ5B0B4_9ASTR
MRGKKTNEFTNTGLTQLEKQPPDILTHTQAPGTLEALDNVRMHYASGCNVPSIGDPTSVFVLPFGGVSASEEMLNFLGVPSAFCPTDNTRLYLNVFQKCSEFCEGNLRRERTTTFRGIGAHRSVIVRQTTAVSSSNFIHINGIRNAGPSTLLGGRNARGNSEVSLTTGEATCSRDVRNTGPSTSLAGRNTRDRLFKCFNNRGIRGRPSINVRQTATVCPFNFIHDNDVRNTGPSILRGRRNTCANPKVSLTTGEATCSRDDSNTGTSTSRGGRNTCVNPGVSLTTTEATYSSGISRRRSVRRRSSTRGPTVGSSSAAGPGTSYTYTDFGDSDQCCHSCGASFWYGERLKGHSHNQWPEYHLSKIDESINAGRGPYVFKVSGQIYHWIGSLCLPPGEALIFLQLYIYDTDNEVENRMRHFGGIHNSDLDPQMVEGLIHFLDAYTELVQLFRTTRDKCRELDIPEFKIRLYNGQGAHGYTSTKSGFSYTKKKLGNPSFFITFTCNVNWLEIKRFMAQYPELTASDRADVVCRIFEQKIQSFVTFLKEERRFRNVIGVLYIVKFQKQGLPHCHTLLWVDSESKIKSAEDVDQYISGELPDPRVDLDGYNIVSEMMMHGPCGAANFNASCMKGDKPMGESSTEATPSLEMVDEIQNYVEGHFILHLQDMQRITFRDRDRLRSVVDLPGKKNTTLTEWFAYNASNEMGRHLSYLKFPSEFVWHSDSKSWPPQRNSKSSIGPACEALGLLGNDREWETVLEEACVSVTSEQLRFMSQDIPKKVSEKVQIPNYHLNSDSLQGYTLYELEIILNNYGKSLQSFGLPPPPADLLEQLANRLLIEERNCNREELIQLKNDTVPRLNADQKAIYDLIINADENSRQKLIFVYDHGGIGITSLFLPSGSTAHSRFKLPLELTEESLCRIKKNTQLGKLLADTNLIIWDEAPMNDRHCFEALDRSLRDIVNIHPLYLEIDIPATDCLTLDEQGILKLINFIYDQSTLHTPSAMALQQKAIVCPKNEIAVIINSKVLDMVPGESTSYTSQDEATPTKNDRAKTEMLYPVEHLNTLKLLGFPPRHLELKVGAPVMLLRNVNLTGGYVMVQG